MARTQSAVAGWLLSIAIFAVVIVLVVGGVSGLWFAVSNGDSDSREPIYSSSVTRKPEPSDSFEQKIQDYVINKYSTTSGLEDMQPDALDYLADEICAGLQSGGDGRLYLPEFVSTDDETTVDLAIALNYAYATNVECALTNGNSADNFFRQYVSILAVQGEDAAIEWGMRELNSQPYADGSRHGQDLYQYFGGTSVRCRDGSTSNAGGKQGACSWHGGVAE